MRSPRGIGASTGLCVYQSVHELGDLAVTPTDRVLTRARSD